MTAILRHTITTTVAPRLSLSPDLSVSSSLSASSLLTKRTKGHEKFIKPQFLCWHSLDMPACLASSSACVLHIIEDLIDPVTRYQCFMAFSFGSHVCAYANSHKTVLCNYFAFSLNLISFHFLASRRYAYAMPLLLFHHVLCVRTHCSYHDWQAGNHTAQFSSYSHTHNTHTLTSIHHALRYIGSENMFMTQCRHAIFFHHAH